MSKFLLKKIFFIAFILSISNFVSAQITMPTGNTISSVSASGGTFTDDGGAAGNYSPNCNSQITICPTTSGNYVTT
jgi:hypothetical protein